MAKACRMQEKSSHEHELTHPAIAFDGMCARQLRGHLQMNVCALRLHCEHFRIFRGRMWAENIWRSNAVLCERIDVAEAKTTKMQKYPPTAATAERKHNRKAKHINGILRIGISSNDDSDAAACCCYAFSMHLLAMGLFVFASFFVRFYFLIRFFVLWSCVETTFGVFGRFGLCRCMHVVAKGKEPKRKSESTLALHLETR